MLDSEKTEKILEFLNKYYTFDNRKRTFIRFPELRLGTGYSGNAQRRMDFFVISSNAGNNSICYEIKVSKSDFKNDVNKPLKQRGARLYANEFYYITPKGLLNVEDIPLWAGLIEVDLDKKDRLYGYRKETIISAPFFDKVTPSWSLICAMIRKIDKESITQKECNKLSEIITQKESLIKELQEDNSRYTNLLWKNKIDID